MAVRQQDFAIGPPRDLAGARVYRFPEHAYRRRAARRRKVARRRLVLAVVVAATILGTLFAGGRSESASPQRRPSATRVVVAPGQTLWDIALRHAPSGVDLRAYVDALAEANGIRGHLPAGARIVLP